METWFRLKNKLDKYELEELLRLKDYCSETRLKEWLHMTEMKAILSAEEMKVWYRLTITPEILTSWIREWLSIKQLSREERDVWKNYQKLTKEDVKEWLDIREWYIDGEKKDWGNIEKQILADRLNQWLGCNRKHRLLAKM